MQVSVTSKNGKNIIKKACRMLKKLVHSRFLSVSASLFLFVFYNYDAGLAMIQIQYMYMEYAS